MLNTQVIYKQVPTGVPDPSRTFQLVQTQIEGLDKVHVPEGHLLVKTLYLSIDPYMRTTMRKPEVNSYRPAALVGKPFMGRGIVEVIRSNDSRYEEGQVLMTFCTWEEYSVIPAISQIGIHPTLIPKGQQFPVSYYLGVLGVPGLTAFVGLHKFCEPIKPGETIFISAAAGAVGQLVGQYAKVLGLRVVGSVGSDDKVDCLLNQLGFDAAFNYKEYKDVQALVSILKKTCPNGIDIYFENVGGQMLEAVLEVANNFARISACGMISQYNRTDNPEGVHNLFQIISKRIRMQGFIATDHASEYGSDCVSTFSKLLSEGKIKYKETVTNGIDKTPQAFVEMLQGKNVGKAIVKVV